MRLSTVTTVLAMLLPAAGVSAAEPAPDLSAQSINEAVFDDWQGRADALLLQASLAAEDGSSEPDAPADETEANSDAGADVDPAADSDPQGPQAPDPFLVRLQVLLDRAHISPGVVDGYLGDNTKKAVRIFEESSGLPVDGEPDAEMWARLVADAAPTVIEYEISQEDADEPFVKAIPPDYAEMAKMKRLGYRGLSEMLGERFHIDEDLLKAMNPEASFASAGDKVLVPEVGPEPTRQVLSIVVDKTRGELFAYDGAGTRVASYPATIGSPDNPSPSGDMVVEAIAPDPNYTYDPSVNFQQGGNDEVLTIPPGPNGPVGSMWIDLSKPTYGIHGTPDPSKIDKSSSHGCVRLANWDVTALSELVDPKRTTVTFAE